MFSNLSLSLRHLNAWFLGIIPLVGTLEGGQHLNGPDEDGGQEQGDQEANPDGEGQQGVTVPVVTESNKEM